ncbi:MAG: STAS domain-containing protein [Vibrio gallaecicus]|uniref:STAS domain-containing protein n=1 Tax=Vibrio gallaecicus TaxID=552386 RepID=A0ABV4NDJ2_9VIBR|nr:STAS domain-containing protein [Vibrio gallaecicus]MDN3616228.1 STAS domain-containing protein [Vibrio gallaecicus]
MSLTSTVNHGNNNIEIAIEGAFGFNLVQEFRQCYYEKKDFNYTIDFRRVDYIDSAGLGMLLNMQKYLSPNQKITITNTMPQVKKILLISRFDKKFMIE